MRMKRFGVLFILMTLIFCGLAVRLTILARPSGELSAAAATHGSYRVVVSSNRGTVYDTALKPLTNDTPVYYAVVAPSDDEMPQQLSGLAPYVKSLKNLEAKLSSRLPFVVEVSTGSITAPGVTIVSGIKRYDENMAPQLIGTLDSEGKGASGVEKALDSVLKSYTRTLTASFPVDASGKMLTGLSAQISAEGGDTGGVVLTIDKEIQQAAQTAAEKYLQTGAIVVMEPKTGDILASVSVPSFSPNDLSAAVKAADSPMLNRAFSAYNLGSVFKIVMVASALEGGVDPSFSYTCSGSINVNGQIIHCAEAEGHGKEDMSAGFANSCNTYFVNLGQHLGGDKILEMAKALGLASSTTFYPGFTAVSGALPTSDQLAVPVALANLSIGEGSLMVTPVQVARIVSTVVNGGLMPTPRLVKELVDNNGSVTKSFPVSVTDRVFSDGTAELLRQFMIRTVTEGTGTAAQPQYGGAGGKTGTAETGIVKNGKTIDQAWFAGFYPAENPKYVVVAMKENGTSGGANAGPAFKYIADFLASRCGYPEVAQDGTS